MKNKFAGRKFDVITQEISKGLSLLAVIQDGDVQNDNEIEQILALLPGQELKLDKNEYIIKRVK